MHSPLRRGVAPEILLSHVRNTMPFLFEDPQNWIKKAPHLEPLLSQFSPESDFEYFRYCLTAHHATVSSFVPTDVDNQIRLHLWQGNPSTEVLQKMAELVLESNRWDYRPVSPRWVQSPETGARLAGHDGEWFSTAVAAYGALKRRLPEFAKTIRAAIEAEVLNEAQIFSDLVRARDGVGVLKACTLIAHNLGDLNRVIEMWNIENDPAMNFGIEQNKWLAMATDLNRQKMAAENHRHFALRKPRPLRRSVDLFLPLGPFLDDWGRAISTHPLLSQKDIGEIVEALIEGLEKTPGSIGYTRAIAGIEDQFRGGRAALHEFLPAREARKIKSGTLRSLISQRKESFEQSWSGFALQFCKNHKK